MDTVIAMNRHGREPGEASSEALMPPEAHLAMPVQLLDTWRARSASPVPSPDTATLRARAFVFTLTLALTGFGTSEIIAVVSPAGATWLQVVFAALFAVTFAWIAFAAAGAVVGCWRLAAMRLRPAPAEPAGPLGRNALVMPIYNEDSTAVFGRLAAMAEDLADNDLGAHFDIMVLSDTREAGIAEAEMAAAKRLRALMSGRVAVH